VSTLDEQGVAGLPDGAAAQVDVRRLRRQRRAELVSAVLHSKTFLVGMGILIFWVFSALAWRWIVRDPQAVDPSATLAAPSTAHWFGTDNLGRDVFARVIAGSAPVLTIAPLATLLGITGGATLGLVTGYYRGWIDDVFSRVVDALLAFPLIILAVLVLASLGREPRNVILVIGIIFTPLIARTVRSAVMVPTRIGSAEPAASRASSEAWRGHNARAMANGVMTKARSNTRPAQTFTEVCHDRSPARRRSTQPWLDRPHSAGNRA